MSAGFDLALIGAPSQLWLFSSSSCLFVNRLNLVNHSVSMRLRPKRYFHIIFLILFFSSFKRLDFH